MAIDPNKIWIFRIIAIENLKTDLRKGLYSKNSAKPDAKRVIIGSSEIIGSRDQRIVKCYKDTVVNDYIPFYFSFRTPMLYNIITGLGVPKRAQKDIVYLCCQLQDLATNEFQWCFTNANAAEKITKFYNELRHLEKVDWHSIRTTDFRNDNADGDEDRIRKKHAEFLVKDHVPRQKIKGIAVLNAAVKEQVDAIASASKLQIEVKVKPNFYF